MEQRGISDMLRARRRELGLSLSALAKRADTSPATLSRYENGWNRFEIYTLKKLASALGCKVKITFEPAGADAVNPSRAAAVRRLHRLFWDRELKTTDLDRHPRWVAERVLEYGALADVRTLIALYGRAEFLEIVSGARLQSSKTRRFWLAMLKKEGMSCTRKYSRETASDCWPR
jgi:transcriptional regulator with XRE-family HTH domain